MHGYNVLHPMAGMPSTAGGTQRLRERRIQRNRPVFRNYNGVSVIGISFDWTREINSSTPEYYRWTQWVFCNFTALGMTPEETPLDRSLSWN
jgi:leucyl-tRNA synthetase